MEGFSRDLRGQGASRRLRARAGRARRAAELSPGDRADSGDDLVVFPSNQQLALRAHGMAPATLRRHLAALVDCGLMIRRDSPNGKRYARKGQGGDDRAGVRLRSFARWSRAPMNSKPCAEEVRAEERALKLVRERITLCRRDIAKMIATGIEEGVPVRCASAGPADWLGHPHALPGHPGADSAHARRALDSSRSPRNCRCSPTKCSACWKLTLKQQNSSANESQNERHIQNSNPDSLIEFEPASEEGRGRRRSLRPEAAEDAGRQASPSAWCWTPAPISSTTPRAGFPTGAIFSATVAVVRPMLGISPSAWEEAQAVDGREPGRDRRRRDPAARRGDHQRRRLSAGTHAKRRGRDEFSHRPDADGVDRRSKASGE